MFAVAVIGETVAIQFLKQRLLRAEARQRRMAERDPLTGVLNRRSFDAALEEAVSERELGAESALVLFDFNDFKLINDVHGHPVGDEVLRAVAGAGERVVRERDCLARIGGDEFAVVAPGAGREGVERLVEALDDAIRGADMPAGVGSVRATFGWAVAPDDGAEPASLLVRADERLLERKPGRASVR
jgi:diguanylate cyclase (GGDEF)-like protein